MVKEELAVISGTGSTQPTGRKRRRDNLLRSRLLMAGAFRSFAMFGFSPSGRSVAQTSFRGRGAFGLRVRPL